MLYEVRCLNGHEGMTEEGSDLEKHIEEKLTQSKNARMWWQQNLWEQHQKGTPCSLMPEECVHCVNVFRIKGTVTPEGIAKMHPLTGFVLQSRNGCPV